MTRDELYAQEVIEKFIPRNKDGSLYSYTRVCLNLPGRRVDALKQTESYPYSPQPPKTSP
jgi:hypothetical protein